MHHVERFVSTAFSGRILPVNCASEIRAGVLTGKQLCLKKIVAIGSFVRLWSSSCSLR